MIDTNNINSAFVVGQQGLQRATEGITQASVSIAQGSTGASNSLTSDVISLQVNSLNAQASARVLDVANETVGTLIDTLA